LDRRHRRRSSSPVGGTNGKGSTIAFLEAMLRAQGRRVGAYTSPHLLRYNERVRIDGADARTTRLVARFERIEARARRHRAHLFRIRHAGGAAAVRASATRCRVLEVGLGGRLDAVNIIDADAAIVTTVDLDHQDWLGNDRDSIGREKAGIFRRGRPAIVGDAASAARAARATARSRPDLRLAGRDSIDDRSERLDLARRGTVELVLPRPAWRASSATSRTPPRRSRRCIALRARSAGIPRDRAGVRSAHDRARLQRFAARRNSSSTSRTTRRPRACSRLVAQHAPAGRTHAVFGALSDKDVRGIVEPLREVVSCWHLAGLASESPRGLAPDATLDLIRSAQPAAHVGSVNPDVDAALDAAFADAKPAIASSRSDRSSSPRPRCVSPLRAASTPLNADTARGPGIIAPTLPGAAAMDLSLKQRLLGAIVLIALAVIFVPMFLSGPGPQPASETVNLAIPPAPDREFQNRVLPVEPRRIATSAGTGRSDAGSRSRRSRRRRGPPRFRSRPTTRRTTPRQSRRCQPKPRETQPTPARDAEPVEAAQPRTRSRRSGRFYVHLGIYAPTRMRRPGRHAEEGRLSRLRRGQRLPGQAGRARARRTVRRPRAAEARALRIKQVNPTVPGSVVQLAERRESRRAGERGADRARRRLGGPAGCAEDGGRREQVARSREERGFRRIRRPHRRERHDALARARRTRGRSRRGGEASHRDQGQAQARQHGRDTAVKQEPGIRNWGLGGSFVRARWPLFRIPDPEFPFPARA
jgi:dihydrofolate synthase/folylpolyglutamate synthase